MCVIHATKMGFMGIQLDILHRLKLGDLALSLPRLSVTLAPPARS